MKASGTYLNISNVKAYIVLKGDRLVAKIILKYPRDGAGRLNAQAETWDEDRKHTNLRGHADGYGYNKANTALSGLVLDGKEYSFGGKDWQHVLEADGYRVIQAV